MTDAYRTVRLTVEQTRETVIDHEIYLPDYLEWLDGADDTEQAVEEYLTSGRDYPEFLAEALPDSSWEWDVDMNEIVRVWLND